MSETTVNPRWPAHGSVGLGLIFLFWAANWFLNGLRSHWAFFPLWLGYTLTVDALVVFRRGNSLLGRNPAASLSLFLISAPAWWLFELLNWRTQNWQYDGRQYFTNLEYALLATLSFSTVIPAVFSTAELASTFRWLQRIGRGPRILLNRPTLIGFFLTGWIMLAVMLLWPIYFFPFLWLSIFFILEPINVWLGHPSLARYVARGDWRPVIALWVAGLTCGFFWELWNFLSYPKWTYSIPFVNFLRIFEMPLLGYGGYLPFTMELYSLYRLLVGYFGRSPLGLFGEFESPKTAGHVEAKQA